MGDTLGVPGADGDVSELQLVLALLSEALLERDLRTVGALGLAGERPETILIGRGKLAAAAAADDSRSRSEGFPRKHDVSASSSHRAFLRNDNQQNKADGYIMATQENSQLKHFSRLADVIFNKQSKSSKIQPNSRCVIEVLTTSQYIICIVIIQ